MTTPRLGAPELVQNQAVPETTVNEIAVVLDAGSGGGFLFLDRNANTPPGSPVHGDTYLLGGSPTGAWSGQANKIAIYINTAWTFRTAKKGFLGYVDDESIWIGYDGSSWATISFTTVAPTESIILAPTDETTAISAGTAKITFRMPYAFTLTGVRASLTTAQTGSGGGGIFTVDINEGGTTILSTKLTIDNTEKTSTTAATPAVISDSALANDAEITVDVDQIGDGTAKGLKVVLIGHQ